MVRGSGFGVRGLKPQEARMNRFATNIVACVVASSSLASLASLAAAQSAVEWRVADGGNGHWYQFVFGEEMSWQSARLRAATAGGYLACPSTQLENEFVGQVAANIMGWGQNGPYLVGPWLGGYQLPDSPEPTGGWQWLSGEPWDWAHWWTNEPNDGCGGEDYLHLLTQDGTNQPSAWWNDSDYPDPCGGLHYGKSFVIEWSADCNSDGIIDYGQIAAGELDDANANNIPDCCEAGTPCGCTGTTLHVPSQYATIQSAINAACGRDTVLVAAGTYTEHISFNGKNVVVRGAGAASTIIDGTGPAESSVVRFTGAEPATAALESVTVRDGTTGTPFPPNPAVLVGGGIFGYNSAASIRNCVIEQNVSGFGGGAYFYGCTGSISGCTIRNNSAGADGGGLQVYGGAVAVVDCTIADNYTNSRGAGAHVVLGVHDFTRVAVTGNYSNNTVGGLSWVPDGGALARLTLDDCTVTGNTAAKQMGGIGAVDDSGGPKLALLSTLVCSNTPMPNAAGPFTADGASEICDCYGDVIQDGLVNGVDLAAVLTAWGTSGGPTSRADCNRDGIVGGPDLTIVLSGWGVCPP